MDELAGNPGGEDGETLPRSVTRGCSFGLLLGDLRSQDEGVLGDDGLELELGPHAVQSDAFNLLLREGVSLGLAVDQHIGAEGFRHPRSFAGSPDSLAASSSPSLMIPACPGSTMR